MYVAVCGAKGHEQVSVREDKRVPGSTRKKTVVIKNYGNLKDLLEKDSNFVSNLKAEIARERVERRNMSNITVSLPVDDIDAIDKQSHCYSFGHMLVKRVWSVLKLDEFFNNVCKQRNKNEIKQGIYFLTAHRIGSPASIRSTSSDQMKHAGIAEVTPDVLYSVLDILSEEQDALIEHLSKIFAKQTSRTMDTVSYDVTNYYFESTAEGELRLFGYSKEHTNNEVLVVMGLLIDSNGIPVTMQLFAGNTMDQNTLTSAVEKLDKLYGIKNITVVADRGMNSGSNLTFISDNNHHFVVSYTLKKAKKELRAACLNGRWDEINTDSQSGELIYASKTVDYKIMAKVPLSEEEIATRKEEQKQTHKKGRVPKYKIVEIDTKIHVTYSSNRAYKDRNDRERTLKKLNKRMSKPGCIEQSLHYGANKYLSINSDVKNAVIDYAKVQEDAKWDGYYAVITDKTELTTEEVMNIYMGQWKIEESFRILKTDLEARPVYVWKDEHIKGHFVMCYLALCIIRYIQYILKINGKEVLSAARIMKSISDPLVTTVGKYPHCVLIPTNLSSDFIELADTLGFKKLENNMTPTRFKSLTKLNLNKQLEIIS